MSAGNIPKLHDVVKDAIAARLLDVWTAIPAKVIDYDKATQSCSVQIITRRGELGEDGERIAKKLEVINHVPVKFLGSGDFSQTWPILPGDTVLLQFTSGSIDRLLGIGGDDVDPEDDRRFSINDAIAAPGLRAFPDALPPEAYDDEAMVLRAPKTKIGSSAASQKAVGESALVVFGAALNAAIATLTTAVDPAASALQALADALGIGVDGSGWGAGTTKLEIE